MAKENAGSPENTFSVETTIETGAGNAELINDLMSPETSTTDPEDLEKIDDKSKEIPKDEEVEKEKEVSASGEELISTFLDEDSDEEDEEEEEEIIEKEKEKVPEIKEEEEAVNQFSALSKDLKELGVFTEEEGEEEIKTPEDFLEKFNNEKRKGALEMVDNFIGQFGEDYKEAFNAIFVKGMNPKEYFGIYNEIVNFSDLDLSNEDNQVRVIKKGLANQGFEPEDINEEIERIKNYGDLETVATKHHKVLVKNETIKLQQKEKEAEQQQEQKELIKQQYIKNVQSVLQEKLKAKEFDGIPINTKIANELQDFLLMDKWKTSSGETLTDFDRTILELKKPENHATKVKVALLLKLLEKDPTLSTIQRSAITKKSDHMFGELAKQVTKVKNPVKQTQGRTNLFHGL